MKGSVTTEFELSSDVEVTEAVVSWDYEAEKISGPPENCNPSNWEWEVEVKAIRVGMVEGLGGVEFTDKMTPAECHVAVAKLLALYADEVYEQAESVALKDWGSQASGDNEEDPPERDDL